MQRLDKVEADVSKLSDLGAKVATIEERTGNMAENTRQMREDLGRITGHLLDESRSFSRGEPIPRRRGS